jgi:putative endopeptidase
MRPRWKRGVSLVDGCLGEALGELYVAEHFPPEAKAHMEALVANLGTALKARIEHLDWMSAETQQKALAKWATFKPKVGYPDKWRSYDGVTVTRSSWYENRLSANLAETARNFAKIGQPVDRGEWRMTPPTVNAFYSPTFNSINFPAGILQPPFYSPLWDDAVNYGAIGAVIGHEMTHGFDDQGRQFDAAGNLRDWWTPGDAAAYTARANQVEAQFSSYTVLDTMHVNGKLTLGENIADLGGVALAYAAFQKANAGKPQTKIDGFTPEQRFFLGYAGVWRRINRDEALRTQVLTDPHSPSKFRVMGPMVNHPGFAGAFSCAPGTPMNPPAKCEVW